MTKIIRLNELEAEALVDTKIAAQLLGLSFRTVQDMASRRQLPCYKIGRCIRFKVSELIEFREARRIA